MCGRFSKHYTWEQLHAMYGAFVRHTSNLRPSYNVCPTQQVDAVMVRDGERRLESMRWGLVPSWWKKTLKDANKLATFNVRSETIDTKPMFRGAWKQGKRCIIPVSGYYEWQAIEGDKPQPWYFTDKREPILSVAGLWDEWMDVETGKPLLSCTMAITEPNAFAAEVHDRMPVLLRREQHEDWLSGKIGKEGLVPAGEDLLQKWPVSKRVNSSRADDEDATLIDAI
jgi:putative SOS response-associated peptidase YedK